jgi:4-amino-4-deoxy-L-arabinose transferase-like glycosyltransferase
MEGGIFTIALIMTILAMVLLTGAASSKNRTMQNVFGATILAFVWIPTLYAVAN